MMLTFCFWLARSRNQSHQAQNVRDTAYREQLNQFQRNVQLGTHRKEVEAYLSTAKVSYMQMKSNLAVKIGEEPASEWYCDRWYVYIEFRFNHLSGQKEPLPLDNLDSIAIQKIGHCL